MNKWTKKPIGFCIHWEGQPRPTSSLEETLKFLNGILNYHFNLKNKDGSWTYAWIAYNYAIDSLGNIIELRGREFESGAQKSGNTEELAILMLDLTEASKKAFNELRDNFIGAGFAGDKVEPHSRWVETACPGEEIKNWIKDGYKSSPSAATPNVTPPIQSTPAAVKFPLPSGHWYSTPNKDPRNHSGFYSESDAEGVKQIQQALGIPADGKFGNQTLQAVRNFQQRNGLRVDGMVGEITWPRLVK